MRLFIIALLIGCCAAQVIPSAVTPVPYTDARGNGQIPIEFPGYGYLLHGDGVNASNSAAPCPGVSGGVDAIDCQGFWTYYDLKNDPTKQYNFSTGDTGLIQNQLKNVVDSTSTTLFSEWKQGGQACSVTEANNVRVKLTCSGGIYSFGNRGTGVGLSPIANFTSAFTRVVYRNGGAGVGTGSLKIYADTAITYTGANSPVTIGEADGHGNLGWFRTTGEPNARSASYTANCGQFTTYTLSPWNVIFDRPGVSANRNYFLLATAAPNSSTSGEFLPTNPCATTVGTDGGNGAFGGPAGASAQPTAGTLYSCNGATAHGCTSQTSLGVVSHINALWVNNQQVSYASWTGSPSPMYFIGGLRQQLYHVTPITSLTTNVPAHMKMALFIGDNGINTEAAANSYSSEYFGSPSAQPTLTLTNATGGTWNATEGYWEVARTTDTVKIQSSGTLHSPAFYVTNWTGVGCPSSMLYGTSVKTLNNDYVCSLSSTNLLLQVLFDMASSTALEFSNARGAGPGLLTNMTPRSYSIPGGWTLLQTFDPSGGSIPAGQSGNGNFVTTQLHGTATKSLGCLVGDGIHCGNGNSGFQWQTTVPAGNRRFYVSWWEYLDSNASMNDEMFNWLRIYQGTGAGNTHDKEAILDYFQNNTGDYNSVDAELLWNIQFGIGYQMFLGPNGSGVPTLYNWYLYKGQWNQKEADITLSTVTNGLSIPNGVTVSITNSHAGFSDNVSTYTRSSGCWDSTDGLQVGDGPHFTGFSTIYNNNGTAGYYYNWTVATVSCSTFTANTGAYTTNESVSTGLTYYIDHADGAYTIYFNGVPISAQSKQIMPGQYDFSAETTHLELAGSYSKVAWRAPVAGNCETTSGRTYATNGSGWSPAFTGTCQSKIGQGQCGYETFTYGWDSGGHTRDSLGNPTANFVSCTGSGTGTPMPNPPSFNWYLSDVIVMSYGSTSTSTISGGTIPGGSVIH